MIKKVFYDLIPITIVIAMFAFTLGVYFNIFDIPFLYQYPTSAGGQVIGQLWRFDITAYLRNLDGSFNSLQSLKITPNPLQFRTTEEGFLDSEFWEVLINNIAYMFNYIIYFLNVVLFIFRFIAYLIVNILAILGMIREPYFWTNPITGVQTLYEVNWLMSTATWICNNLEIPMIEL